MKRLIFMILILIALLVTACSQTTEIPTAASETAVPEPVQEEIKEEIAEEIPATAVAPTAVPTVTQPAPTADPTLESTPEPTAAPIVLGEVISEDIIVEAADGLELKATFTAAEGLENAPGIILLHMLNDRRQVWDGNGVTEELANNGYAVLALDMRGHGSTGGTKDWDLAEDDLQRIWQYFVDRPEVDGQKTAVMGGSIGANMALITTANEPTIRTAILLSPGLDYRGVTTEDRLADYGERPLLIVASNDDTYAADSSRTLAETAVGETQLQIYETAGHGTRMFAPQPDLMPLILTWLDQQLINE